MNRSFQKPTKSCFYTNYFSPKFNTWVRSMVFRVKTTLVNWHLLKILTARTFNYCENNLSQYVDRGQRTILQYPWHMPFFFFIDPYNYLQNMETNPVEGSGPRGPSQIRPCMYTHTKNIIIIVNNKWVNSPTIFLYCS